MAMPETEKPERVLLVGRSEYIRADLHARTVEALREAEKALERFNRGGITLFGNEEDVPITFKGKDFQALRAALTRIKEATDAG